MNSHSTNISNIDVSTIVREGAEILRKCRQFRKSKKEDGKECTEDDISQLHKRMVKEHSKFAEVYIIPLRSIVIDNVYYDDVMERFVKHLVNHKWDTRKEFVERQAEYMVYLYRRTHPRHGSSEVAKYKQHVLRSLHAENQKWDMYEKEVKEEVEKEMEEILDHRRERIYEALMKRAKAKVKEVDAETAPEP